MTDERAAQLARSWRALDERVRAACEAVGRDRAEVTVVAITKTFPAEDVARLADLGVTDVGENRDQEASEKVARCHELGVTGLRWHFVGQLQTNKARSVASYADVVHSVDRVRLARALDKAAVSLGRRLDALVQVDLDDGADRRRGGAAADETAAVVAALATAERLTPVGLMAVAPREGDPGEAFGRLASIAAGLRATYPSLRLLSAGMSGDLEAAVAHGATHLRVGRALLGSRPPLG